MGKIINEAIEKLIKEYKDKVNDCDTALDNIALKKTDARANNQNELDYLLKEEVVKQAQKQAYAQAQKDFESLLVNNENVENLQMRDYLIVLKNETSENRERLVDFLDEIGEDTVLQEANNYFCDNKEYPYLKYFDGHESRWCQWKEDLLVPISINDFISKFKQTKAQLC